MGDSRDTGTAVAIALVIVLVLVLLAGGGALFIWQRQAVLRQEVLARNAEAEAARARALAEQRVAQATQAELSDRPNGIDDDPASIDGSIRTVLQSQQRAWNAGDIEQFMDYYWKSDDLTFSSGGKLTRTWQGTLENYKERYPSPAAMGQLSFHNLEVTLLGTEVSLVLGEWQLSRDSGELGGNFTLVFRRLDDKWVIVHDHTSRTEP